MAYRFTTAESFAQGIERIARAQGKRIERLLQVPVDPDLAVHQARRGLKRLRSLLAIARPALGEDAWRADDGRVRDIGRLLAGARDAKAMLDTLDRLAARDEATQKGRGIERLRAALEARLEQQRPTADGIPAEAMSLIAAARRRAKAYGSLDAGIEAITEGMARTYRTCRKAMHNARASGGGEAFHAWRRHVQRHWRHMLLLEAVWEEEVSARARSARELGLLLGEDHDLHVLCLALERSLAEAGGQRTVERLRSMAATRQAELRRLALPLGLRLFAERGRAIEERFRLYWLAAVELTRAEEAVAPPASRDYAAVVAEEHADPTPDPGRTRP